jgi:hypothetical protein
MWNVVDRWALVAALVLLTGCATAPPATDTVAAGRSALAAAAPCCTTLAEAPRTPLPLEETSMLIGVDRPVFDFDGRRAFFVLFELPRFTVPYSILVDSQPSDAAATLEKGGGLFGVSSSAAKTLLTPGVLMLDENFRTLRRFDHNGLRPRGDGLERTVFVNASNDAERYIAIYGIDREEVVTKTYGVVTSTPIIAGGVGGVFISGQDQTARIHFAPTGVLRVKVDGLPLPARR